MPVRSGNTGQKACDRLTWQKGLIDLLMLSAGFVDCDLVDSSLTCDFYGVTQTKPVYTMQLQL